MDDMALWADSTTELTATQAAVGGFLADRLKLAVKPVPYINRTARGMDFLGCLVFSSHQLLNARSRKRFRRRMRALDLALGGGQISEAEAQQRSQAMLAFTRTTNVRSWRFRRRVLDQMLGDGQGLGACAPRR